MRTTGNLLVGRLLRTPLGQGIRITAYYQGADAQLTGIDLESNPWDWDTPEYKSWHQGWYDSHNETTQTLNGEPLQEVRFDDTDV